MEQQVAQTLWLHPGTCVLNPLPTMQYQPTSSVTSYHQFLKQQQMLGHSVQGANLLPGQTLLQQGHLLQGPQGLMRVPHLDNLLVPTSGKQIYEVPYATANLHVDPSLTLPLTTTLLPTDFSAIQRIGVTHSKIAKKKRISPSAKRRSRLRLIAFLEAKKKQQGEMDSLQDDSGAISSECNENSSGEDISSTVSADSSPESTTTTT